MKKQKISKRLLCICLFWLMVLPLASCKGQADGQDSQPPTATIAPTEEPTPTPAPTPPIPYTDVPSDAYYYDAVVWAYQKGITSDGNTFEPDSSCTRAQMLTFIWRAMGSPEPQTTENPISDISPDDWYYKPALWAYENGVTSNTTFNPGNPCTNAEVITTLWRANGEPAAAVYNSSVSLANPGQYYTRAVAWADNGGMFVGKDSAIDPAAPCSRADLMVYLYWATDQWTFSEEDKTVQVEYEQIINGAQLYEVHGSGLVHADYIDVDGDGKVELLTMGLSGKNVTATVYANIDGHAETYCEKTFSLGDLYVYTFSICKNDARIYLSCEARYAFDMDSSDTEFYLIESGSFVLAEQLRSEAERYVDIYYFSGDKQITGAEYSAMLQKYTDGTQLLKVSYEDASIERGLLPTVEEYWVAYWTAANPIYGAVLNGDFSAFAGTYTDESGWGGNMSINKDGVLTAIGGYYNVTQQKPISVTVTESGAIRCVIQQFEWADWDGRVMHSVEYFILYPAGVSDNGDPNNPDYQSDPTKVRLEYWWPSQGVSVVLYSKIS